MAPHSSGELVVSCICQIAGLRLRHTPILNAGVASPPDVVHLYEKEAHKIHSFSFLFQLITVYGLFIYDRMPRQQVRSIRS